MHLNLSYFIRISYLLVLAIFIRKKTSLMSYMSSNIVILSCLRQCYAFYGWVWGQDSLINLGASKMKIGKASIYIS